VASARNWQAVLVNILEDQRVENVNVVCYHKAVTSRSCASACTYLHSAWLRGALDYAAGGQGCGEEAVP
jgi:hypothetical protein